MSTNVLVYRVRSQYMLPLTYPSECTRAERRQAWRTVRALAMRLHIAVKEAKALILA